MGNDPLAERFQLREPVLHRDAWDTEGDMDTEVVVPRDFFHVGQFLDDVFGVAADNEILVEEAVPEVVAVFS
jgi:hypothetical protein